MHELGESQPKSCHGGKEIQLWLCGAKSPRFSRSLATTLGSKMIHFPELTATLNSSSYIILATRGPKTDDPCFRMVTLRLSRHHCPGMNTHSMISPISPMKRTHPLFFECQPFPTYMGIHGCFSSLTVPCWFTLQLPLLYLVCLVNVCL